MGWEKPYLTGELVWASLRLPGGEGALQLLLWLYQQSPPGNAVDITKEADTKAAARSW